MNVSLYNRASQYLVLVDESMRPSWKDEPVLELASLHVGYYQHIWTNGRPLFLRQRHFQEFLDLSSLESMSHLKFKQNVVLTISDL